MELMKLLALGILIFTLSVSKMTMATVTEEPPQEEECECDCDFFDKIEEGKESNLTQSTANMTKTEKLAFLGAKLNSTKKALKVNTSNVASALMKKVSARDDRQSSANLGYLGIALLVSVPTFLVVLDLASFSTHLGFLLRNLNLK